MKTEIAKDIDAGSEKLRYDAQCKRVLSNKEVLAWILRDSLEEVSGLSIPEIVTCIEGRPSVGETMVGPGGSGSEKAAGGNTEDAVPGEGTIYYGIRFLVRVPRNRRLVRILINVEAQKSYYPGYSIVTRGIFYGARMISAQMGTEFQAPDYNGVKKVVSIWVCMEAPGQVGNAISLYRMVKQDLIPGIPDQKESYDKLSVVQICLHEERDCENRMVEMLNTLLSVNLPAKEKKRILSEAYGIHMDTGFGKEIDLMCNLSDYVEEKGIKKGIKKGIEKGKTEAQMKMAEKLLHSGKMTDEEILSITDLSKTKLEEIKKKLLAMA